MSKNPWKPPAMDSGCDLRSCKCCGRWLEMQHVEPQPRTAEWEPVFSQNPWWFWAGDSLRSRNFLPQLGSWSFSSRGSLALGTGLLLESSLTLIHYISISPPTRLWTPRGCDYSFLFDFQSLSVPGTQEVPFMGCLRCSKSFASLTLFGPHPKLVGCNKHPHFI